MNKNVMSFFGRAFSVPLNLLMPLFALIIQMGKHNQTCPLELFQSWLIFRPVLLKKRFTQVGDRLAFVHVYTHVVSCLFFCLNCLNVWLQVNHTGRQTARHKLDQRSRTRLLIGHNYDTIQIKAQQENFEYFEYDNVDRWSYWWWRQIDDQVE